MKQWERQVRDLLSESTRGVPASGAGYRKGDAKSPDFLIQAKATEKEVLIIRATDIAKALLDARKEERICLLQYEVAHPRFRYACLRYIDFSQMAYDADWKNDGKLRFHVEQPEPVYLSRQRRLDLDTLQTVLPPGKIPTAWRLPLTQHDVVLLEWTHFVRLSEDCELKL